jgi:5'-nucleotidase
MKNKRILITNDDGINAEGIQALSDALKEIAQIWVVAPNSDRSGCSHALTLNAPVRINDLGNHNGIRSYSVNGTPSDCVYLSLSHLMKESQPDLVVSGINHGFNLADDITYSGTVAAALEAVLLDIPAIAISLESIDQQGLETAKSFALDLSLMVMNSINLIPRGVLLNVNIPKGGGKRCYRITSVGRRQYTKDVKLSIDPRGKPYFWIGGNPARHEDIPGSDCNTVFDDGLISITPIHVDMTHQESFSKLTAMNLPFFGKSANIIS